MSHYMIRNKSYALTKENLEVEIIMFPFVKIEYQLSDALTNEGSSRLFYNLLNKWTCMRSMHQLKWKH